MKQIIRLTESDLHRLVKESVRNILAETDASSTGDVNCPVFPMVRRAPILGDKTKKVDTGIDPKPAISRDGGSNHSLAVNYANESIIREAVEESVRNWLKTAALGGMMAFSPMQANAQSQDYQQQPIQQTQQVQQNKPVHQRGTYWDLADDAAPVQKVTKQDIAPVMQNIIAVTKNLTDWLETINKSLLKVSPEQKRETENAILTHCVKNKQTGKLVNANDFTLNDASYIKRVYDTGDNLVSININGTNYFISVAALNEAMQIMGIQKGSDNLINAFKYHR